MDQAAVEIVRFQLLLAFLGTCREMREKHRERGPFFPYNPNHQPKTKVPPPPEAGEQPEWHLGKVEWFKRDKGGLSKGLLKQTTSFFIANFPEEWKQKDMWKEFKKYGRVIQIYIANKNDKWGRKFGFVRFLNIRNPREMELNLSKIQVGDRRLQANLAMYNEENGDLGMKKRESKTNACPSKQVEATVGTKSYADAVRSNEEASKGKGVQGKRWTPEKNSRVNEERGETEEVWECHPSAENEEWLKNCLVRQIQRPKMITELKDKIMIEGFFSINITPMGGNMVLIHSEDEEEISKFNKEGSGWTGEWLSDIRPWSLKEVAKERYTWLQCYGMPLNIWNEEFFKRRNNLESQGEQRSKKQTEAQKRVHRTKRTEVRKIEMKRRKLRKSKGGRKRKEKRKMKQIVAEGMEVGLEKSKEGDALMENRAEVSQRGISISVSDINNCNRRFMLRSWEEEASELWAVGKNLRLVRRGGRGKKREIREMLAKENFDVVFIQETKMDSIDVRTSRAIWGVRDFEWVMKPTIGQWGSEEVPCLFSNVYAPCDKQERRRLWAELQATLSNYNDRWWCIGGDFNAIRSVEEKQGKYIDFGSMDAFNNFISSNELVDLPMKGRKYTWYRSHGKARSRLDRFLVSDHFLQSFQNVVQWGLGRSLSDHCPIMLQSKVEDWGPKPFRTIDSWLTHSGFEQFVKEKWNSFEVRGWGGFRLKEKLKMLKKDLRIWNKEVFGVIETRIEEAKEAIKLIDEKNDMGQISELEKNERASNFRQLQEWVDKKSNLLYQKARLRWLKERDANSKYFHSCVARRKSQNSLGGIVQNGRWIDDVQEVKTTVKDFFREKFREDRWDRPVLESINFNMISDEENAMLVAEFGEEEIKEAVWNCGGSKSPGPDGFNFNFIKRMWSTLKEDICDFFREFHRNGKLVKGSNTSFIVLVPKKTNLQVLHDMKKSNEARLIFKADFEKAYDNVEWGFLDYMMDKLGFNVKWRIWMKECVSTATVSILINEALSGLMRKAEDKEFRWAKVNFDKSWLYGMNIDGDFLGVMALIMNCSVGCIPFKYLGVPIGANPNRISTWRPVIECMRRRLEIWGGWALSFGGRIALLKVNKKGSAWWRGVWKLDRLDSSNNGWLKDGCVRTIGDGKETLFWQDVWIEGVSLKERFPRLFSLATNKSDSIAEVKGDSERVGEWQWSWRRNLFVWEHNLLQELTGILSQVHLKQGQEDHWTWRWESTRNYSIRSAYHQITQSQRAQDNGYLNQIWKAKAPLKVAALAWRAFVDRLPTKINLAKRGIIIDKAKIMCSCTGECKKPLRAAHGTYSKKGVEGSMEGNLADNNLDIMGKDNKISQMGSWINGTWNWNLQWRRRLYSWEEQEAAEVMKEIQDTTITRGKDDVWEWIHTKDGGYSTRSAYQALAGAHGMEHQGVVLQNVWNSLVPNKMSILGEIEGTSHLFIHCEVAYNLGNACLKWWEISATLDKECWKVFQQHSSVLKNDGKKESWGCILFAIIWTIWLARNMRIFKGKDADVSRLLELVQLRVFNWIKCRKKGCSFSLTDWF
ncbi:hypothetical protein SLEP1_g23583 [Rubroshorea leprosula]|uniref:RRM domain-containing protein n=1 Tax=Rubroshorea leprosula TaxID=152421 RepID=A0AAV5JCV6_9ROSI|nr:hypothetical protein SLEP1_g23583 [Rubroshorea leprosula]